MHFKSVNAIDEQGIPAILESNEMFSTIQEANHNQLEMPSKFRSGIHMVSGAVIDIETAQGSNATMQRIHKAATDKKQA